MKCKVSRNNIWGFVIALILTIGSVTMLAGNQTTAGQHSSLLQNSDSTFARFLKPRPLPFFLNTFDTKGTFTVLTDEATVRTNKSHYNPGETAKITGENFGPNEMVTLQVTHTDGTPPGGNGHDSWTVTADASGFFITTWYVNPDDSSGSAFSLTAVSSTASASTTFSDPGPSADLDQCRNGTSASPNDCTGDGSGGSGWANGNVGAQQGHYIEGYSIPYRMRLAGMTAGDWTLDMGYDTVHSSAHAIDFLTHYDLIGGANVTPTVPSHNLVFGHTAECIDPSDSWISILTNSDNCAGVAFTDTHVIPKPIIPVSVAGNPPGTFPCTAPYPGSDVLAGAVTCPGTTFDAISGAGQAYMTMWNGTITDIQYVSGQQNVVSGQGQQHTMIRIYFHVTAGQAAADGGNVDLGWGGHIGRSTDWGTGNSAGGISGSPYHMNLHGLCAGSTPNNGTLCTDGGSQDRSLSAAAVFATGNVIINKVMQTGSRDGTFNYTGTGTGIDSNFSITTVSGSGQKIYNGVPAGTKTVTESGPSNPFLFVSLVCTDPDNGTTVNGKIATIDVDANETVTCTYTNREDFNQTRGRIIVVKDTIPNDTTDFTFTTTGYTSAEEGNPFTLKDTESNDSCGVGNDNCLVQGIYSVAETANAAYSTTSSCDDGSPVTAIDVAEGETVTCTFVNRKPDAQIDLSPLTATNAVNSPHTITATVQQDDTFAAGAPGDGATGFGPAPNGTLVTFSLLNNTAGAAFVGGVNTCTTTGGTGQCSVQINTSTAGGVDIHATTTFNVLSVSLTRATGTGGLNSADAHKTYVDAQIDVSPLTATNAVNSPHTITATVQQDDGIPAAGGGDGVTGFAPAPNGTLVTFSLLNNTAGAAFVGGVNTCTTTGGTCSVQINTSTAGGVDIHATTTFSVGGVSLTRATGTGGLNSADAHKTYVDAQIDLSPLTATNIVNQAHTITATVQQDDGIPAAGGGDGVTGFAPAPNGTLVTFSLLNNTAGAAFVGGVNTCTTSGGTGTCTVQINTSTPGGVDIHATTTFSVGGVSLTRATGTGGLNSADAHKTYVNAQIDLSPLTATNAVNSPHTITATVQQDDGIPAAGGGDGVTGFGPAPNGTLVTFSLLNNTAGATFVGAVSTCTTTGGTCSVQINTSTAGGVDIHATTTFSVGGQSITVSTGTGGLNSADAHKTYVDAQIDVSPLNATNPVGSPHTITATVQQDDGIPAAGGGDGVTGFGPAPNGTLVTFSLLNNTANATFVGGVSTCTTTAGTCSVQINTNTPGAVDIHATTTFSVGGVSLTRSTGSGGLNSADAHKVYEAGSITIVKDAVPNAALDFNFTSTSDQLTTIGNFSLDDDADGTLPNSRTFSNLAPGNYTVTEAGLPISGWDLTNLVCVGGGANTSSNTATGVSTIGLDAGESVTCSYTNTKQTKLKLVKTVTNNNGGSAVPNDWDLTATGSGGFTELTPDGANATFRIVTPNVTYALGETGPSGYAAGSFSCNGGTQVGDSIQLSVGQVVTCTINNDDIPPQLHLRKIVVNNNGGTATVADFPLTANGTGANDLTGTSPVDSGAGLQADTWALSETSPGGYSSGGGYVCVGGTQVGQSITVGIGGSATCTITNDDIPGTIIIQKITKPVNDPTSFNFDSTGTDYVDFSLTGQAGSNTNSQTLNAGNYSVQEITIPDGWTLTGIGDPANGNNCVLTVTGSGTSTGTGDLSTQTATIHLGIGDTIRCTFENTGSLVTRTQGFWATHTLLAEAAWFGGEAGGHKFSGVASVAGIGDTSLCGREIDSLAKLMGGFWADIPKKCGGGKRTQLDQARMRLLQQLLAAELNAAAFGSVPSGGIGKFAQWEDAFCNGNIGQVNNAQSQAAAFNTAGDSGVFTPGTSADAKNARTIADTCFWDSPAGALILNGRSGLKNVLEADQ